jgi:hypothetical protein
MKKEGVSKMLTKEAFKKLILELVAIREDEDGLNKAFKKFEPDFNYISFGRYEQLCVNCLKLAMEDTFDYISYFLYERDAKFTKKKIISDKDGKKIPFDNYDDLYNIIVDSNKAPMNDDVKEEKQPQSNKKKEAFKFPWQ